MGAESKAKKGNDVMSEWNKKWADGIYEAETAGGK